MFKYLFKNKLIQWVAKGTYAFSNPKINYINSITALLAIFLTSYFLPASKEVSFYILAIVVFSLTGKTFVLITKKAVGKIMQHENHFKNKDISDSLVATTTTLMLSKVFLGSFILLILCYFIPFLDFFKFFLSIIFMGFLYLSIEYAISDDINKNDYFKYLQDFNRLEKNLIKQKTLNNSNEKFLEIDGNVYSTFFDLNLISYKINILLPYLDYQNNQFIENTNDISTPYYLKNTDCNHKDSIEKLNNMISNNEIKIVNNKEKNLSLSIYQEFFKEEYSQFVQNVIKDNHVCIYDYYTDKGTIFLSEDLKDRKYYRTVPIENILDIIILFEGKEVIKSIKSKELLINYVDKYKKNIF